MSLGHMKQYCVGCQRSKKELESLGIKFNKEHLTPEWLIRRCGTHRTSVRWLGKSVSGLSVTIPLCKECNDMFGAELEVPVQRIFDALESGKGISDNQAELLVRWMWKFEGMQWHLNHVSTFFYSEKYTLRQRVLGDIDEIRPYITLSISRIRENDPSFGDKPMGLDSYTEVSGLFVSGVFSELAIMTSYKEFDSYIPQNFSKYNLAPKQDSKAGIVFWPKVGFMDDSEAVATTIFASKPLSKMHDAWHRGYIQRYTQPTDEKLS